MIASRLDWYSATFLSSLIHFLRSATLRPFSFIHREMHRRLQADLAVADAYVPEAPPTPVEFTDISESVALAQTVSVISA